MAKEACSQNNSFLGQDVINMNQVEGFVGGHHAGYVCQNSMIKRLSLRTFDVLRERAARYVLLILLEKPANKDKKRNFETSSENNTKDVKMKLSAVD